MRLGSLWSLLWWRFVVCWARAVFSCGGLIGSAINLAQQSLAKQSQTYVFPGNSALQKPSVLISSE